MPEVDANLRKTLQDVATAVHKEPTNHINPPLPPPSPPPLASPSPAPPVSVDAIASFHPHAATAKPAQPKGFSSVVARSSAPASAPSRSESPNVRAEQKAERATARPPPPPLLSLPSVIAPRAAASPSTSGTAPAPGLAGTSTLPTPPFVLVAEGAGVGLLVGVIVTSLLCRGRSRKGSSKPSQDYKDDVDADDLTSEIYLMTSRA